MAALMAMSYLISMFPLFARIVKVQKYGCCLPFFNVLAPDLILACLEGVHWSSAIKSFLSHCSFKNYPFDLISRRLSSS